MARKGWQLLSENYRKRLVRNGITQQAYESGASLSKARGHEVPTGGGSERQWESLLRLAYRANWKLERDKEWTRAEIRDALRGELGKGFTPAQLKDAMRLKLDAQKAYRNGDKTKAHNIWARRNPLHARELYFYHTTI